MNGRTRWMVGVCVVVGLSVSAPMVAGARVSGIDPLQVGQPVVTHMVDRATGLDVRVERSGASVKMETSDGHVSITKQMTPGRSETTIASPDERVRVVVEQDDVRVVYQNRTVSFAALDGDSVRVEQHAVRESRVVNDARGLLARMSLNDGTATGQAFGLTSALLGIMTGDAAPVAAYRDATMRRLTAPQVVPIGQNSNGPLACFDIYSVDAIKIYDELVACKKDLHWYDLTGAWACDAIYVLKAEMAMDWLFACEGSSGMKAIKGIE